MFKHLLKPARTGAVFLLSCLAASVACAADKTTYPDAAASDPKTMGWMVGAPPPRPIALCVLPTAVISNFRPCAGVFPTSAN